MRTSISDNCSGGEREVDSGTSCNMCLMTRRLGLGISCSLCSFNARTDEPRDPMLLELSGVCELEQLSQPQLLAQLVSHVQILTFLGQRVPLKQLRRVLAALNIAYDVGSIVSHLRRELGRGSGHWVLPCPCVSSPAF